MNDKHDFDTANIKINPDNDYPLPKRKPFTPNLKNKALSSGLFGKIEMPFVLLGIGLVAFVGIYMGLSVMSGGTADDDMVEKLTARLDTLEQKINQLESQGAIPSGDGMNTADISSRLDRAEATLSLRLNVVEKRLDDMPVNKPPQPVAESLPVKEEVSRPVKDEAPAIVAAPKPKKKSAQAKLVYHTVKKGDTYYSISKKHGLTVEKLQKMNKLKPEAVIVPGQKLVVKR
jgi:LysM repeat protein